MSQFISRFGMYAQKVGMSRIFLEKRLVAITLLKVVKSHVIAKKEVEDHAVVTLGIADEYKGKIKQPQAKHYERMNLPQCKFVREFKVTKEEAAALGSEVGSEWINIGCLIDVQSKSIGKGFAGAMKMWNFSGSRASHGASLSHRSIGSTGTRDKIFKQRKMPGRMGQETITIQGQQIVYKDEELGLIGLIGSVPGKKGTWVRVSKAIKGSGVAYGN